MLSFLAVINDVISEAWWELKRARLRTYLAIGGVVVGAMGLTVLICVFHLDNALQGKREDNSIYIGIPPVDSFNIFGRKPRLKRYEFTPADGEALQKECPYVEQVGIKGTLGPVDIKGKKWHKTMLESTNITRADRFPGRPSWGRILTPADMKSAARVVAIGEGTNFRLWPREQRTPSSPPASRYIHINGVRFEVIGVLQSDPGNRQMVIIPYTTMQDLFWNARWSVNAVAKRGFKKAAAKKIDEILYRRIGDPGYTYVQLSGISYEELRIYTFFGIIGVLILFSAGMAVSNKTYIDTLERVQQFAMRRALGATKFRIYAIVLTESALICGFGCFYGGAIGWMIFASFSAQMWIGIDIWYALPLLPLGTMFLFVIALGIAGSLQAAAIAAKANPAEVLARKDVV